MSTLRRLVFILAYSAAFARPSSSHDDAKSNMPVSSSLRVRDEPSAKDWMETIKDMTDTWGSEAKFFENLEGEESSHAFSHAFALAGCLADLVSGFLGDASAGYIKAIQELQTEFDTALSAIQSQLDALVRDLQEDFMKILLAPNAVILDDTVKALTQFSSSNKASTAKKVWLAQMEPINDRVDAWNKVALCMMGQLTNCPGNMLDVVLADGKDWPRPAVLVQFVSYHYGLLSSSATAICAYERSRAMENGLVTQKNCSLIDVTKLKTVASTLSKGVTSMKAEFFSSLGPNKLPALINSAVNLYPNKGYDGSKAIRDLVGVEMDNFYFQKSLTTFFGINSWSFAVYGDITGSDKHFMWATGFIYRHQGYNIMYTFEDGQTNMYKDTDCRSGDAHTMASCLNNMHHSAVWVLKYNTFWSAHWMNVYSHSYTTTGGDVRIVAPGATSLALNSASGKADSPGTTALVPVKDLEGVAMPRPAHEGVVLRRMMPVAVRDVPSDPESVLKDISNIFATAGAIADFFGPEGEVVGLVLDFIASIFNMIAGLLGLGKPDPVIEALRTLEKDVMGRLSAVQDGVAKAKSTAQLGSIGNVLDNAEVPLLDIVGYWNVLYPQGSTKGKLNTKAANDFKSNIGNNIAKYRDQWNILVQCLSGSSVDCIFGDKTALQILLMDGQTYMRPYVLTETVQYYYLLLQKSSVAICAYAHLFLDDKNCTFLPSLKDGLTSVSNAIKKTVTDMHQQFWSDLGPNKLPPVFKYWVDREANQKYAGATAVRDAIEKECDSFYFADGLDKFFGVNSWAFTIYGDVTGSDKHFMWATGFIYRYNGFNIMYTFENGAAGTYKDTDCRSGDAHTMATCLHNMHNAAVWVLKDNTFWAAHWQGVYSHSFTTTGGDVRIATPGQASSLIAWDQSRSGNAGADIDGRPLLLNVTDIVI